MKKFVFSLVIATTLALAQAQAAVEFFNVTWSGATNGNTASAFAIMGIDTAAIPNAGSYIERNQMPAWLDSVTLTITGATTGNGTFTLADFEGIYWNTSTGVLDFSQELVGQVVGGQPWGFDGISSNGDFNLFPAAGSSTAPRGVGPFMLAADGGGGDAMRLTSFAPVPEPQTYALFAAGVVAVLLFRRRKAQSC